MHYEQNSEEAVHLSFTQNQLGQLKGWCWNHLKNHTLKFWAADVAAAWELQGRLW